MSKNLVANGFPARKFTGVPNFGRAISHRRYTCSAFSSFQGASQPVSVLGESTVSSDIFRVNFPLHDSDVSLQLRG